MQIDIQMVTEQIGLLGIQIEIETGTENRFQKSRMIESLILSQNFFQTEN